MATFLESDACNLMGVIARPKSWLCFISGLDWPTGVPWASQWCMRTKWPFPNWSGDFGVLEHPRCHSFEGHWLNWYYEIWGFLFFFFGIEAPLQDLKTYHCGIDGSTLLLCLNMLELLIPYPHISTLSFCLWILIITCCKYLIEFPQLWVLRNLIKCDPYITMCCQFKYYWFALIRIRCRCWFRWYWCCFGHQMWRPCRRLVDYLG